MSKLEDFVNSSAGRETLWYADQDTKQVVGFCPSCKAELRLSTDGPSEFRFAHKDSCTHSDEKRAQRLVDDMMSVLEDETDNDVAFSAVTFLSASMCAVAAEDAGVPLDVMAQSFVRALEERLGPVGQLARILLSEQENVA